MARRLTSATVGTGLIAILAVGAAAKTANPMAPHIKAIRQATTPSMAIAAYSDALAIDRRDVKLHETYFRKMIDFGLVDLLSYQAQLLVKLAPDNGLGWAVLSFQAAERGKMPEAFVSLGKAVKGLPDDTFVLHLAGQLVAWYDRQPDKMALPTGLRVSVEKTRAKLGDKEVFKEGYKAAKDEAASTVSHRPFQVTSTKSIPDTYDSGAITYRRYNYDYYSSYPYYSYYSLYTPFRFSFGSRFFPFRRSRGSFRSRNHRRRSGRTGGGRRRTAGSRTTGSRTTGSRTAGSRTAGSRTVGRSGTRITGRSGTRGRPMVSFSPGTSVRSFSRSTSVGSFSRGTSVGSFSRGTSVRSFSRSRSVGSRSRGSSSRSRGSGSRRSFTRSSSGRSRSSFGGSRGRSGGFRGRSGASRGGGRRR